MLIKLYFKYILTGMLLLFVNETHLEARGDGLGNLGGMAFDAVKYMNGSSGGGESYDDQAIVNYEKKEATKKDILLAKILAPVGMVATIYLVFFFRREVKAPAFNPPKLDESLPNNNKPAGQILFYNLETKAGIISGADGNRYNFIAADISSDESTIVRGANVHFTLDEQNSPTEIQTITSRPKQPDPKILAVKSNEPKLVIAPWLVTLILAPILMYIVYAGYYAIHEMSASYIGRWRYNEIDNFFFKVLLSLSIIMTVAYWIAHKITLPLKYTETKAVYTKDKSGKAINVGFLSLHPISIFVLFMPSLIMIASALWVFFHKSEWHILLLIGMIPLVIAIYSPVINKQMILSASGDESNSAIHKYTTFNPLIVSLMIAPGLSFFLSPFLLSFIPDHAHDRLLTSFYIITISVFIISYIVSRKANSISMLENNDAIIQTVKKD